MGFDVDIARARSPRVVGQQRSVRGEIRCEIIGWIRGEPFELAASGRHAKNLCVQVQRRIEHQPLPVARHAHRLDNLIAAGHRLAPGTHERAGAEPASTTRWPSRHRRRKPCDPPGMTARRARGRARWSLGAVERNRPADGRIQFIDVPRSVPVRDEIQLAPIGRPDRAQVGRGTLGNRRAAGCWSQGTTTTALGVTLPNAAPGTTPFTLPDAQAIQSLRRDQSQECSSKPPCAITRSSLPSSALIASLPPRARSSCVPSGDQARHQAAGGRALDVPPSAEETKAPSGVRNRI